MFTIEVEEHCSCVKKAGLDEILEFEERQDMINKARVLECRMNQEFCMTHYFEAMDCGEKIIIKSTLREEFEDEDDVEDACDLVRNSTMVVGFDAAGTPPKESGGN
ncbi:hypothetical protein JHD50_10395 [Sulfurimonas sp. MAG313]|nr:hypothetical protein [Sulfurimonas sp. MAG313]MDF1881702.1 hypothetical protein [Sulfurimonas sp. MAG313]